MKEIDEKTAKKLNDALNKGPDEFEKVKKELEKEGYHIPNTHTPDALKTNPDDIIKQLMPMIPKIINQHLDRDKRYKLVLDLTPPELFKVSEFMMKEGIGKTQVMEDP